MTAIESKCSLVPLKTTWDGVLKEYLISIDGKTIGSARCRINRQYSPWLVFIETPFVQCGGSGDTFSEAMGDALTRGAWVCQTDLDGIKAIAVGFGDELAALSPE